MGATLGKTARHASSNTKLNEYSKLIAKHGIDGIKPRNGLEKSLADERVSHLICPPFKLDPAAAVKELPKDVGVRYEYLTQLVNKVHTKSDVRAILTYVKSFAASNLTPDQRANLVMECLNKLRYIDVIGQFLGG